MGGPPRNLAIELELFDQERARLAAVVAVANPPHRLYIGREIARERFGVVVRPRAHHKRAGRLVGAEQIDEAAKALETPFCGLDRERQIEDSGRIGLILDHRPVTEHHGADLLDRVIARYRLRPAGQEAAAATWAAGRMRPIPPTPCSPCCSSSFLACRA